MSVVNVCRSTRSPASIAAAIAIVLVAAMAACTAEGIVRVTIDLLSFMSAEDATVEATVPSSPAELTVFVLPGVQIITDGSDPNEQMRAGSLVETPPQSGIAAVEPSLVVRVVASVENTSETQSLANVSMVLYIAGASATDVYAQGTPAASAAISGLAPLARDELALDVAVGPNDPAYDDLLAGGVRAGVRIDASSGAPALVPVTVTLRAITASLAVRPFGVLE